MEQACAIATMARSGILLTVATLTDHPAAEWAKTIPPGLRHVALAVTAFGASGYMFAGSALVAAAAWSGRRSSKDDRTRIFLSRMIDHALFFFVAIAASGLAVQGLKHVIGRVRPRFEGDLSAFTFHPLSLGNAYASLPSGHTTSGFAAATALALMIPRGRPVLFALAVAIGASRVALSEHYPSDVVCGAALGTVLTLGLSRVWPPGEPLRSFLARKALPSGPGWCDGQDG